MTTQSRDSFVSLRMTMNRILSLILLTQYDAGNLFQCYFFHDLFSGLFVMAFKPINLTILGVDMVDKELPLQVIHLMLNNARFYTFVFSSKFFTHSVERLKF